MIQTDATSVSRTTGARGSSGTPRSARVHHPPSSLARPRHDRVTQRISGSPLREIPEIRLRPRVRQATFWLSEPASQLASVQDLTPSTCCLELPGSNPGQLFPLVAGLTEQRSQTSFLRRVGGTISSRALLPRQGVERHRRVSFAFRLPWGAQFDSPSVMQYRPTALARRSTVQHCKPVDDHRDGGVFGPLVLMAARSAGRSMRRRNHCASQGTTTGPAFSSAQGNRRARSPQMAHS